MLILAMQMVIGLAIGFALRLVFVAVEMAGDLIGTQMGLGFAMFYDPGNVQHTPILGQFMGLLATLVFLAINGHLMIIAALAQSFQALPITAAPLGAGLFEVDEVVGVVQQAAAVGLGVADADLDFAGEHTLPLLGSGLLTRPLGPSEGLRYSDGRPSVGRGDTVGRPCHNVIT